MQEKVAEQKNSNEIIKQEIDYNYYYKKWYKRLPNILAIIFFIPFLIFFVVSLIMIGYDGYLFYFLPISIIVGFLVAFVVHFLSMVILSHKIMVVNELQKLNKKLSHIELNSYKNKNNAK